MRVTSRRRGGQRGSMAAELAILAPIIIIFMLLMVGLGRVVEARGQVNAAARAAARAASVQRSGAVALAAATDAARNNLDGWCTGPATVRQTDGVFTEGALVTYRVTCVIDLSGLKMIGFEPTKTVTGEATVPLDQYRRVD